MAQRLPAGEGGQRIANPASLNKAQDDFGCGLVQMYPDKGVIVDGNIICGSNFHGGDPLKVTGTMERVR